MALTGADNDWLTDTCTDNNIHLVGSNSQGCDWYDSTTNSAFCGNFDVGSFDANTDCCACGGGTTDTSGDPVLGTFTVLQAADADFIPYKDFLIRTTYTSKYS